IAAALLHPSLQQAIASGAHGRIAITLMLWSNGQTQVVPLPWRFLSTAAELERAAGEVLAIQRTLPPGGTGLAAAIGRAASLLLPPPFLAERREIDVSGDGQDNEGGDPGAARDRAVALGITINGLAITDGSKLLVDYYRREVIGGAGAFLEPARNIMAFKD